MGVQIPNSLGQIHVNPDTQRIAKIWLSAAGAVAPGSESFSGYWGLLGHISLRVLLKTA